MALAVVFIFKIIFRKLQPFGQSCQQGKYISSIKRCIGKNGGPYWIGIKRMKTTWIWYDGTEYDPSGNGFRFAKTVDDITSAECALIVFDDEDSEYEMVKVSCTTVAAMGWICEGI